MIVYTNFIDCLNEPFWGGLPLWSWLLMAIGLILILVGVLFVIIRMEKRKKQKAIDDAKGAGIYLGPDAYKTFEGLYFTELGAKVIVSASKVWLISASGKTELINSADNTTPTLEGEKFYIIDRDMITKIVKVGGDYEKIEKERYNYLTLNFIDRAKIIIDDTTYMR